jgi:hypothetical protein
MKIDFNREIMTVFGKTIPKPNSEEGNLKLSDVSIEALIAVYEDERNLSGKEKMKRYSLAQKILKSNGQICEIELGDANLIKDLIGKAYGPMIVGPAYEMLEGTQETANA